MKTKIALFALLLAAVVALLLTRPASAQPPAKQAAMEFPLDLECVVTVEMQGWMHQAIKKPEPTSGLHDDFTIRGRMVYFGEGWVVLREGTFDNWVSRDRIVAIRASR